MTEPSSRPKRGCRYFFNLGVFTLVTLLIAAFFLQFIAHPYFLSNVWAHPGRVGIPNISPDDYGLDYQDVTFNAPDGIDLKGWYIPSKNGAAIILMHSFSANRAGVLNHAEFLAEHGYGVLLFDLRAHGESGGDILPYGSGEGSDVKAAVDWLYTQGDVEHVGVMGLSLGANFAVFGAVEDNRIKAIVTEGLGGTSAEDIDDQTWIYKLYDPIFFAFLNWRTGVTNATSIKSISHLIDAPILAMYTESEEHSNRGMLTDTPNVTHWLIPEVEHIGGLGGVPDYEARVLEFFDAAFGFTGE